MKKFLVFSIIVLLAVSAFAERKALVIGNASYAGLTLASPVNDSNNMENALSSWGYTVTKGQNLNLQQMTELINSFSASITANDDVFFYFSGFGGKEARLNYLLPAGSNPGTRPFTSANAYKVDELTHKLSRAKSSIIFLEASRSWGGSGSRATPLPFGWQSICNSRQSLIFSAAPERVVENQNLANSAFTQALIQKFSQGEDPYNEAIPELIREFRAANQNRQVPWFTGYLDSELYFNQNSQRWRFKMNNFDIEGGGSLSW